MQVDEFSEEEWQEIFDELRLLVQRAGYGDWDRATIDSLSDDFEDVERAPFERRGMLPPHMQLERYTKDFIGFLRLRSKETRERQRNALEGLLRTETGTPVADVRVDVEGRALSLDESGDDPDAMIAALNTFLHEIAGEETQFWSEAEAEDREEGRDLDEEGGA